MRVIQIIFNIIIFIVIIIIIIIIITYYLGLDRSVSAFSKSLLQFLQNHLRPFGP